MRQKVAGITDRFYLSMSGQIASGNHRVPTGANKSAIGGDDYCPDRQCTFSNTEFGLL